ncbi:hypothetical protein ACFYY2_31565 [Streptomyces sp. NPDC001822]|uniref:hypothetical protein n=1 Tax=Streptomyces sp. NPDC001822 TaxID=3364614 RepID=UPI0036BF9225
MARLPKVTIQPRYTTASPLAGHGHRIVDTRSGYTLTEHPDADAARLTAEEFNTSPLAAINAVRALDDTQSGPAAHVLRSLRRYGYNWALEERDARTLHRFWELDELTEAGHLTMVWSTEGKPFYVAPPALPGPAHWDSGGQRQEVPVRPGVRAQPPPRAAGSHAPQGAVLTV